MNTKEYTVEGSTEKEYTVKKRSAQNEKTRAWRSSRFFFSPYSAAFSWDYQRICELRR